MRPAPSVMTTDENARLTCQVPRTNDFFMGGSSLLLMRTKGRSPAVRVPDRPPNPFGCRRHLDVLDAEMRERVHDRVGDRRHGADAAGLARALDAERVGRGRH